MNSEPEVDCLVCSTCLAMATRARRGSKHHPWAIGYVLRSGSPSRVNRLGDGEVEWLSSTRRRSPARQLIILKDHDPSIEAMAPIRTNRTLRRFDRSELKGSS